MYSNGNADRILSKGNAKSSDNTFSGIEASLLFSVTIDIDFVENLLFSKYNVELYIDNQLLDLLDHGSDFHTTIKLAPGNHVLKFKKENDSIQSSCSFIVDISGQISCEIKTHSNTIDVVLEENSCIYELYKAIDFKELPKAKASEFIYTKVGKHYEISGYLGDASTVVIPDKIKGLPVKKVTLKKEYGIKLLVLPKGITKLEKEAFYRCGDLETVVLPETLTSLGSKCFYDCIHLRNVVGIENISHFEDWCFYGCQALTSDLFLTKDVSIGMYSFAHSGINSVNFYGKKNVISSQSFNYSQLASCYVNEGCNLTIKDYNNDDAFMECLQLRKIILPASMKYYPKKIYSHNAIVTIYSPAKSFVSKQYKKNHQNSLTIKLNTKDYNKQVKESQWLYYLWCRSKSSTQ